jgi:hypothetical protein
MQNRSIKVKIFKINIFQIIALTFNLLFIIMKTRYLDWNIWVIDLILFFIIATGLTMYQLYIVNYFKNKLILMAINIIAPITSLLMNISYLLMRMS